MDARTVWSRLLLSIGGVAMLLGAVDPLEGAVVILAGSATVLLGFWLGRWPRTIVLYWLWVFILIALGVAAAFALSAAGGIGGTTGLSLWWGLLILPYPVGWVLAVAGAVYLFIRYLRMRKLSSRP